MDSINEVLNDLRHSVIEDKRCISYTYLSSKHKIHVSEAIELLDQFIAEERQKGNDLCLNYLLSGNNDNTDNDNEIKMERFLIVNESDIDSAVDWFKNGFNRQIYSVCVSEDHNSVDLNFNECEIDVKTKSDLKDLQNLTYVQNLNIDLRNTRRRLAIKPSIEIKIEIKEETKSSLNVKNQNITKSKVKSNKKGKNSKNISNMFSKNKSVKQEVVVIEVDDVIENNDPFDSDCEEIIEEVKPLNNDSIDSNHTSDEEVIPMETKVENKKKRNSKNALESTEEEDEEIIVKKKKRSKKYKRVRIISESDSEDSGQQESPIDKFVGTKSDSKVVKRVEQRQESHVDEDGYVVTKTVKIEVEVNEETEETVKENTETKDKTKINEKQNKGFEKKVENKKPKQTVDKKSMTQSSITSFFKPKPIST